MPSLLVFALLATQALALPVPQSLSSLLGGLGGGSTGSTGSAGGLIPLPGGQGGSGTEGAGGLPSLGGLGGGAGSSTGGLDSLLGGLGGSSGSGSGLGSLPGGLAGSGSGSGSLPGLPGSNSTGGLGSLGGLGGLGGSGPGSFSPGLGSLGGLGGLGGSGSGSSSSGLGSLGGLGGLGGSGSVSTNSDAGSPLGGAGSSSGLGGLSSLGGQTANDVQDGVCKGTTFICARGTTEGGNLGSTVCPDLANKLKSNLNGDVAVQGVNYPADIGGAIQGGVSPKTGQGATNMAQLTNQAIQKCPSTKVVLAGYSQGAEQVHGALQNMDAGTIGKISAVTTFGDPVQKEAFQGVPQSRTKIFCAQGDGVCNGVFAISAAHLSYTQTSITPAAQFIQSNLN
ncbi:carbohydrate esterase family 5 protein [Viridothelium virens]|uniref:cutinase n=1 Tax=Viridothelium virens TaxID=1048519 RepID=A0A6A6GUN5_VIRVR|nr:carbohydrate esterase family 5 protein [Viridothelium virens]